jgi:hypothetical protein
VAAEVAPSVTSRKIHARDLDVFLDRVCLMASDVSSFLLDGTYDKMLTDDERSLRNAVRDALQIADTSQSPTAEHVARMLRTLGWAFQ